MHRRISSLGSYRSAFFALGALAVLGGCSSGTVALRPQGGIASVTPATATPSAAPSGSSTATPTPKPTSSATATPTMSPTPTSTSSPSSAFTFTLGSGTITALSFPQLPSGCPTSYFAESFTVQETGYTGSFTATSNDTAAVTVTAAGSATFDANDLVTSGTTPTGVVLKVSDSAGNYGLLPIDFNLVCL
jgi:hypothetical protein